MRYYYRPIICQEPTDEAPVFTLASGWSRFQHVEVLSRKGHREIMRASEIPAEALHDLTRAREPMAGLEFDQPRLMGILNVTPDSFSDGGLFLKPEDSAQHAEHMQKAGADIIDIGGESTRPGAIDVGAANERARIVPVILYLKRRLELFVSIDTRKGSVARAAVRAGADLINDVSGLDFDVGMADEASRLGAPVCLMHAQGSPETMQRDPRYDNVLLDVYDALAERRDRAVNAGIAPHRIILDPGIGFGKTLEHNLTLLRGISLFHGLGCPILVGASRKAFIGTLGGSEEARKRAPGSIAVALEMVRQGVQVLRVHDVAETRQALSLHMALTTERVQETD